MNKSNEKGITLIALVITSIIILILTGIAMRFAIGEKEGIIKKTKQSVEEQIIANAKEELASAWGSATIDFMENKKPFSNETLGDYLDKDKINVYLNGKGEIIQDIEYDNNLKNYVVYYKPIGQNFNLIFNLTEDGKVCNYRLNTGNIANSSNEEPPTPDILVNTNGYVSGSWQKNDIRINLTSYLSVDKYQYSTNGGTSWTDCNSEIIITTDTNATYQFRALDNLNNVLAVTEEYNIKRDSTGPVITQLNILREEVGKMYIKLMRNVIKDDGVGLAEENNLMIFYKLDGENDDKYILAYSGTYVGETVSCCVDTGSEHKRYNIKVVAFDKLGNEKSEIGTSIGAGGEEAYVFNADDLWD